MENTIRVREPNQEKKVSFVVRNNYEGVFLGSGICGGRIVTDLQQHGSGLADRVRVAIPTEYSTGRCLGDGQNTRTHSVLLSIKITAAGQPAAAGPGIRDFSGFCQSKEPEKMQVHPHHTITLASLQNRGLQRRAPFVGVPRSPRPP